MRICIFIGLLGLLGLVLWLTVKGLTHTASRPNLNPTKAEQITIDPGQMYIQGYDVENDAQLRVEITPDDRGAPYESSIVSAAEHERLLRAVETGQPLDRPVRFLKRRKGPGGMVFAFESYGRTSFVHYIENQGDQPFKATVRYELRIAPLSD